VRAIILGDGALIGGIGINHIGKISMDGGRRGGIIDTVIGVAAHTDTTIGGKLPRTTII
jgi:hypothetical protein